MENAELIRENKYLSARNDYGLNARLGYPRIMDETDWQICNAFEAGKNWADENPKPGLVDINKAVKWLKTHMPFGVVEFSLRNTIIEDFKQAMLEE